MLKNIICFVILTICIFLLFLYFQSTKVKNTDIKKSKQIEKSASGQAGKGFLRIMNGDNKSAIEYFTKSIELEPNNPISYHQRGLAYYNLGSYKKALIDFNKTIELNGNNLDAYGNRSLTKIKLCDYKGALEDVDVILNIIPDNPKAINQKQMILNKMRY